MAGKVFEFGVWRPMAEAPRLELPSWIIVTDGTHVMPAFWSPREVSEFFPDGGSWELALSPDDIGSGRMGDFALFMIPPKVL